jgi:putative ABC transport system permease protein
MGAGHGGHDGEAEAGVTVPHPIPFMIGVLERRGEIGLRRALGVTRAHIRRQFLTESVLLSAIGGRAGVLLGIAATAVYAALRDWAMVIPGAAVLGGLGASLLTGVLAGASTPAGRAARLAPTEALRGT